MTKTCDQSLEIKDQTSNHLKPNPIVNPLEPGTQPEDNHFVQNLHVRFEVQSPSPQRCPSIQLEYHHLEIDIVTTLAELSQPQPQLQPASEAVAANPIDQLLQSINNLILVIGNNANQLQKAKVVKCLTFSSSNQDPLIWAGVYLVKKRCIYSANIAGLITASELLYIFIQMTILYYLPTKPLVCRTKVLTTRAGETVDDYYNELKRIYWKADLMEKYSQIDRICQFIDGLRQKLSYLKREGSNNEEISELKKVISKIEQNMKALIQN
ncbi:355_t:CDS:2 [Ambispora leptoticha]|uniref:355_t:CDS:1 n=1 Tax=Ambispora leptoticha TaxID=144679 RepID=A0A9N9H8A3_9GLOM|nr:355_t:CDS:2 [Ambispora leptoticha]